MPGMSRCALLLAGLLLVAPGMLSPAHAQSYPSRLIRLIVPFPPGGGFDGIARPFSEKLALALGQPVIIENRPGATGNIGAEIVARAAPDGYTLLFANDFLATNPAMYQSLPYDSVKDLLPITKVGTVPMVLAIHPGVPARNLKELVALSKNKPLNFGTPGVGTNSHFLGEMLNLEGVMRLVHVPYKGSGPAVADTVGGQIEIVITSLPSVAPFMRAGKLRGIAVLGANRVPSVAELPTLAEEGIPGTQVDLWYGVFAPAGTPDAVIRRLNEASAQALAQPDLIERLKKAGYEVVTSTPEALAAQLKADLQRWERVVREAKIPKQ